MQQNDQIFEALLFRLEPELSDSDRRYQQLRQKMIKFFVWRRCEDPDGLADETISRTVKNLSTGEEIRAENPYSYIYAIAKHVFMEYIREKKKRELLVSNVTDHQQSVPDALPECRTECLKKLPEDKRFLMLRYYIGEENRDALAISLKLSLNALRLQVYRLKQELRDCEKKCLDNS